MAHLRFYFVVFFFFISFSNKFLLSTSISTSFSKIPVPNSLFLHLQCCCIWRIGRLPLSMHSTAHSSAFELILLLSGDIALNPGPIPTHDFRFGFTNIRSIKNKSASLSQLLISHDLDMFGVTETWLTPNETKSLIKDVIPAGYTFHHHSRSKLCGLNLMMHTTILFVYIDLPIHLLAPFWRIYPVSGTNFCPSSKINYLWRFQY